MPHVFISYSSKHRELTEQLAAFLESRGLDVWWDQGLVARGPFDTQIREQLRTAGCIVVIWAEGALNSEWVKIEANFALQHDKLVNVRADDIEPKRLPSPFDTIDAHHISERDLILRDVLAVREGLLLLEDKREDIPAPDARTPAMLLQAKYGLVPFTGSADVKGDLIEWALARGGYVNPTRRDAGRLIHGPGGLGKTRLLIEVAEALRAKGWSAGFLARPDAAEVAAKRERRAEALGYLIRGASDNGLLLVMDYAEGRDEEIKRLAQQIQGRPTDDERPIRLMLLTRGVSEWWTRLVEEDQITRALFGGERLDVQALGGITRPQDRLDLFLGAVNAFAPKLVEMGYAMPTDGKPTRQLTDRLETLETNAGYQAGEGYDRPLAIAMEALLYLAAMAPGTNEPGVHSLLANILGLERAHWPKLVGKLDADSRRDPALDLLRAVAQITGLQGVNERRAAEDIFMADRYYVGQRLNRASVREVVDNVFKIYGRDGTLTPLEPDLIGEHHIGLSADRELIEACLAWIYTEPQQTRREARYRDLITVLQRASLPEHGPVASRAILLLDQLIKGHLETIAAATADVIVETSGPLVIRVAEAGQDAVDIVAKALAVKAADPEGLKYKNALVFLQHALTQITIRNLANEE